MTSCFAQSIKDRFSFPTRGNSVGEKKANTNKVMKHLFFGNSG
jgi:hypothetical protein